MPAQVPTQDEFTALQDSVSKLQSTAAVPGPAGKDGAPGAPGKDGAPGGHMAVQVPFSSLVGATDDDKIAAFVAFAKAQPYHGITCVFDEIRQYTFTKPVTVYSGLSLAGIRPVDQARSSLPIPNKISLNMTGGWLHLPNGTTYGLNLNGLSFDGSAAARVFEPNASAVLWTSTFRDISMQNIASFFGSSTVQQPMDFVLMDGFWNLNNIRDTAWNVAGSDCWFRPTGMNLDTPAADVPATRFLTMFSAFGVADVDGLYITAEQHSGILVNFNNNGVLRIHNSTIEGRNAGAPCYGSLIRIQGGDVQLRDNITHYAMSNPKATGRDDAGAIHITGGNVQILGNQYRPAKGVALTVPYINVAGGNVRVRDIMTSGSDAWGANKPVVRHVGGTLDYDNSVTVVTA